MRPICSAIIPLAAEDDEAALRSARATYDSEKTIGAAMIAMRRASMMVFASLSAQLSPHGAVFAAVSIECPLIMVDGHCAPLVAKIPPFTLNVKLGM
jgi:hypothetical protein